MANLMRGKARDVANLTRNLFDSWKILLGDKVYIRSGQDKGKTGIVKQVLRNQNMVVVKDRVMRRRYLKTPDGKRVEHFSEHPIHVSNVALFDEAKGKPSKAAIRFLEDGARVRVLKSGAAIPPPPLPDRKRRGPGPKDTPAEEVTRVTYVAP
eukprot:jgi/Mesvir1/6184/Mv00871-RA.1